MANYHGTLAAVRSLGQYGIPVTTADSSRLAVSAWSRFTSSHVRSPYVQETQKFLEWLLAFGQTHGKHVLLPTSDDTAWLYSLHHAELSPYFYLSSTPFEVISRLLNKRRLYQEAVDAGLRIPRTWFPESEDDLRGIAAEAHFPVMIKPLTQVMFKTQSKGILAESPDQLAARFAEFARQPYTSTLLDLDPTASRPMVQEFFPDAATGIYNISAYVRDGRIIGARGARKLLQQPRRLGTGVCFEEAPVNPELLAGLDRLVGRVGFSGVFEAEFIDTDADAVLIDFNPRFYNQMGFDIARGLPLPLLAYFDTLGQDYPAQTLAEPIKTAAPPNGRVYVDLFSLKLIMFAQRWSGVLTPGEREKWTDWYKANRRRCTYAVIDKDDKVPAILAALQIMVRHGRHPRNFLKSIVLNRT